MSDGTGNLTYSYDELSRLKEETKVFSGTLSEAPSGGYKLKYNYFLTGGLKSIEDPFGAKATYESDKLGRTTAIGGDEFYNGTTEITSFASSINYRAFGAIKSMSYNTTSTTNVTLSYDTRLRPMTYLAQSSVNEVQDSAYIYNNDNTVKQAANNNEANFTQANDYDFAGRIKRNEFGAGTGQPYKQTLSYDAFGNITSRNTKAYNFAERNFTAGYTNNRRSSGGYQSGTNTFDVAGNITQNLISSANDIRKWKFDAAGRMSDWEETLPYEGSYVRDEGAILTFDGDGRTAKRLNRSRTRSNSENPAWVEEAEYTIFSSITGQKITTLMPNGLKNQTFIYMSGKVIAEQNVNGTSSSAIVFKQSDPITESEIQTEVSGAISANGEGRVDLGALGEVVPEAEPEEFPVPNYKQGGHIGNPEQGCRVDGHSMDCNKLFGMFRYLHIDRIDDISRRGVGSQIQIKKHTKYTPGKWKPTTRSHPKDDPNSNTINIYTDAEWVPAKTTVWFETDGVSVLLKSPINQLIKNAVDYLKTFTPSEDCKTNVIDKLAKLGFTLEDFQKYLEKGYQAYNITESTATVVGNLMTEAQAKARGLTNSSTISETYQDKRRTETILDASGDARDVNIISRTNAVTSFTANFFTVYIRPDSIRNDENYNRAYMFHEALHGFLSNEKGRTDPDIQRAFGIDEGASSNITDYIREHCFR